MCGTFTTSSDGRVITEALLREYSGSHKVRKHCPPVSVTGQSVLFPGGTAWVFCPGGQSMQGDLELFPLRWGLLPSFASDISLARHTYNARSETMAVKPSFREAFKWGRCVVPALYWHEWSVPPNSQPGNSSPKKLRWRVQKASGKTLLLQKDSVVSDRESAQADFFREYEVKSLVPAESWLWFAALWAGPVNKPGFPQQGSFAIITGPAAPPVDEIHHRMPITLQGNQVDSWLNDRELPLVGIN